MWIRCDSDVATGGSDAVPWLDGYYDEDDDHHHDQKLECEDYDKLWVGQG